jgi:O-antigen/teichoic acid export membrane protein
MSITKILGKTSKILSEVFMINVLIVSIGLLTNILIARWFGQENFGIFMYFFSLTNLIYLFASFGFANYIAKLRQDELGKKLFAKIILITLITTLIVSILVSIAGQNITPPIKFWFWLVFLYAFGITFFNIVGGAIRRLEKFRLAIYFSLLNRIVLLTLIVISAILQNFWFVLLSMSIAILSLVLIELPKLKLVKTNTNIRTTLFRTVPFLLALLSMQALYHIDRVSINYLLSFTQLGYFSGYSNFINILRIGAFTIPFVMITKSSRQKYNLQKSLRKISFLLIPIALGIGLTTPYIVPFLFGPAFMIVNYPLIWMMILASSLLVIYSLVNAIYLGSGISTHRMTHILLFDAGLSVVLNLVLNILLISKYGLVGAPLATAITLFVKIVLNATAINSANKFLVESKLSLD